MPHALISNLVHCVFSTKDRANLIPDPPHLCQYLGGIARDKHIPLIIAGGTSNHIHLLIALPAAITLAQAVRDLEGKQLALDESAWFDVCLAGRIRRVQRECVEQEGGHRVHRGPATTPRETQL
jgi:REP element-mobilizing transposase RayT